MASFGPEQFLVTHDLKDGQSGPRLALISTKGKLHYQPLPVDQSSEAVWGPVPPNDVESICPLAGHSGQFLLCESGYYKGKYGRIFHIEVSAAGQVKRLGEMHLPTGLSQDIEGIATLELPHSAGWLVFLGGRGGKEGEPGRLYWGQWDKGASDISWSKEGLHGQVLQLPRRLGPFARTLSDMYVDAKGQLFVSSCTAPGQPYPSRSLIFVAGHLKVDLKQPFRAEQEPSVWWIDGCKIEGIAPSHRPGCGPAFVTDDDDWGGIWRVVPINPSLTY